MEMMASPWRCHCSSGQSQMDTGSSRQAAVLFRAMHGCAETQGHRHIDASLLPFHTHYRGPLQTLSCGCFFFFFYSIQYRIRDRDTWRWTRKCNLSLSNKHAQNAGETHEIIPKKEFPKKGFKFWTNSDLSHSKKVAFCFVKYICTFLCL